jgi:glycosyltransferase involved in cell wall biosynthesis
MLYFIYDYFYPAYKAGGPIQSLVNLTNTLSAYKIKVLCSNKDLDGTILDVSADEWIKNSSTEIYYSSKGFSNFVKALKKNETYYINGMFSLQYNFLPALLLKGRKIISVRGMLHPNGLLQKAFKKKAYLAVWKLLGLNKRCEFHATTEAEKNYIHQIMGTDALVWTIPNLPQRMNFQPTIKKEKGSLVMATIALIGPMKNHLLVLKALMDTKENITYNIYGPVKDAKYWEKCKEVVEKLPANINVHYHGDLHPDKIANALSGTHILIQPSESENFGHSILEALMAGRPVITSNGTPWNQLQQNKAGINVDTNEVNIRGAISFFAQFANDQMLEWSNGARQYCDNAIRVENISEQYKTMFNIK